MEPRRGTGRYADVGRYMGVGLTIALSTGLFLWLGTLADGHWHTEPIFTLLGAFVGAAAGFYHMYHQLVTVPQRDAAPKAGDRPEHGS